MPAMLELPDLPPSVSVALQIGLIGIAGLVAFMVLRAAVAVSVRHLLERQAEDADGGVLPRAELERRVETIGRLVVRIAGTVIAIIAVLMALGLFGIDIGPAVAGLGVVGIAVGFGAQTLVRDWLAGIFIVLENQYSRGDVIRISGVEGAVDDFSLRRTTLRDLDGTTHTVPNGQILVTTNLTRVSRHVNVDVSVTADADSATTSQVVERVGADLQGDPGWSTRLLDPPRVMGTETSPEGSIRITVRARVRAADDESVRAELRRRIEAGLTRAGIEVAPQEQVDARSE